MQNVEQIKKAMAEKKKADEAMQKDLENVKKACRRLFSTADGILVARAMMKVSGMYKLDCNMMNPYEIGAERGKEYMYKFFIKGMLSDDTIAKIESSGKVEE